MTYAYICPKCNKEHNISKPMSDSDRIEHCECGEVLKRIYNTASIKTNDGVKK